MGLISEANEKHKKSDEEYKIERENLRTNIKHLQVNSFYSRGQWTCGPSYADQVS